MSLLLAAAVRGEIEAALEAGYPEEACGALIGRPGEDFGSPRRRVAVDRIRPLANAWEGAGKRTRYEASAAEIAVLEKELAGTGEAILGFYHSHPDAPARPSSFDLERAWPFYVYLIVSVRGGRVGEARCWRRIEAGDAFVEEAVEGIPAKSQTSHH